MYTHFTVKIKSSVLFCSVLFCSVPDVGKPTGLFNSTQFFFCGLTYCLVTLSRPQVDLTFERFRFLAPCQRLRVIVCVLSAHLCEDESSTCVCLRLREQCLRSEITSVSRVANVLLLRLVAGNMDVNTPASKRSQLIGNAAIVRKVDLCVLASFSCRVYAEMQGRKVRPVAGFSIHAN